MLQQVLVFLRRAGLLQHRGQTAQRRLPLKLGLRVVLAQALVRLSVVVVGASNETAVHAILCILELLLPKAEALPIQGSVLFAHTLGHLLLALIELAGGFSSFLDRF